MPRHTAVQMCLLGEWSNVTIGPNPRRHSVPSSAQLLYWRQKYRWELKAADGESFVEIGGTASGEAAQVAYQGGMRVHFHVPELLL